MDSMNSIQVTAGTSGSRKVSERIERMKEGQKLVK
jgi:hypothetical protein